MIVPVLPLFSSWTKMPVAFEIDLLHFTFYLTHVQFPVSPATVALMAGDRGRAGDTCCWKRISPFALCPLPLQSPVSRQWFVSCFCHFSFTFCLMAFLLVHSNVCLSPFTFAVACVSRVNLALMAGERGWAGIASCWGRSRAAGTEQPSQNVSGGVPQGAVLRVWAGEATVICSLTHACCL